MKALILIAGIGLAVSAPLASAQTLAGVTIGDSETKVMKALSGATNLPVENDHNKRVIYRGETMVELCKGKAAFIEQTAGATLTDYLKLVERETAKRGKPSTDSSVSKNGTESWIFSSWIDKGSAFTVQMHYSDGKHRVSTTLASSNAC